MCETINHYAGLWLNWQWSMLWQTAVLVGVVALTDRLVRKWAWPQLRHALWLLVLVKLVLPPTLTSPVSVTSTVPTLARQAMTTPMMTPAPAHRVVREAAPAAEARTSVSEATGASRLSSPMRQPQPVPSSPMVAPASSLSWSAYALGAWLVGVVGLSIGLTIHLRRLAIAPGAERPDDVPAWFDAVLEEAAAEMRLRRIPRVVFTTRVCCPAVFGLLRPVLLIPADRVSSWTRSEARHVLLHELAHIKRGDLLTHAAYMLLVTLYWFNPLLWLIRKHLQHLRELCCDATVARCLREETGAYRDTLLDTGRALLARPLDPGLGLLGLFEDAGALVTRLRWLEQPTWRHAWRRRILVVTVVVLMLCCVLPMASLRAAPDNADGNTFKVTLSNGATLELIGLYRESLNNWWQPDGTLLEEGPYDPGLGDSNIGDHIEIALRYENLPEGARGGFEIEPGRSPRHGAIPMWYTVAKKAGQPVQNISWVHVIPEAGAETVTVKVHLAMGAWQNYREEPWSPGAWESASIGEITLFAPYERAGRTCIPVAHMVQGPETRLTILDMNNVEREPSDWVGGGWLYAGSSGFGHFTAEFDVALNDLVALYFQTRPYTWIEFRNVSLRPGKEQEIEIVVTEPEPAKADPSKVDIALVREHSPMYLKAFHTGVMHYLNENDAKELPERLWPLEFKVADGAYVAKAQFVKSVGYFSPRGYQSLRAEDFTSPTAQSTPILYCKWLLEADGGKGTNVLFGDGHVEWLAARELNRLKETARAEEVRRKSEASGDPGGLTGRWTWTQETQDPLPAYVWQGEFVLEKDGDSYTGELNDIGEGTHGDIIKDVTLVNDQISFTRQGQWGLQQWKGTLKTEDGELEIVDGQWTKGGITGIWSAHKID